MNAPLHHHVKPGLVHFMAFPDVIKGHGEADKSLREILQDEYFEVSSWTNLFNNKIKFGKIDKQFFSDGGANSVDRIK